MVSDGMHTQQRALSTMVNEFQRSRPVKTGEPASETGERD